MKNFTVSILLLFIVFSSINLFAQQTEREKGIELYKQGNAKGAIQILKTVSSQSAGKKDSEVWNYLGLAYLNQDQTKEARKSFEKAIKISPQSSAFHSNLAYAFLLDRKINNARSEIKKSLELNPQNATAYNIRGTADLWEGKYESAVADAEKSIAVNPQFSASYILKSDGLLYNFGELWQKPESKPLENIELLSRAIQALDSCLEKCPKDETLKIVSERKDTVRAFYDHFKKQKDKPDGQNITAVDDPGKTNFKILIKPRPGYTDSARRAGVQGTITLAVVFTADSKIGQVLVLKGLGYGLDNEAIKATRKITFEPEKENGKPISTVKRLQFSFSIY